MRRHTLPRALLVTALFSPAVAWAASTEGGAAPRPAPPAPSNPAQSATNQGAPKPAAQRAESGLRGKVSADSAPIARATVYAYELAQLTVQKAVTGAQGDFRFDQLPSGVYKLIAFKPGYEPAVLMLSRAAAEALQFVELKLAQEPATGAVAKEREGFWTVRDQIPPDVLRDLEGVQLAQLTMPGIAPSSTEAFHTDVTASTGVSDLGGQGETQLSGGGIGMEGKIGAVSLDVRGEFWRMAGDAGEMGMGGDGRAAALALRMEAKGEGQIDFTNVSQHLAETSTLPADDAAFERYRVSWSQPLGERSRSRFMAQYTSQSNFFRPGIAASMPNESRALNLEGAYQIDMTERSSLEAGLRYRQGELAYENTGDGYDDPQRALELFGKAGWQMQPSVLVEYGLFTQMRDGSLALAPQGGVVIQLGDNWQAVGTASHRLETGEPTGRPLDGVSPLRFSQAGRGCQDIEQHCYRVLLARQSDNDGMFAVSAVDREMAETLNLYFDDDFLGHLESLYLVKGDRLPEAQVVIQRRVTPRVLARLESTYADGGGGILYAVDESPYENRVRYLVTSLDTRFQRTDTGVFVAFHHLEQGMEPVAPGAARVAPMELERLQLMLSQDLNVLLRLAADWSVHFDFEVSRGALPFTLRDPEAEDLRRRVTGGLSVKF